MSPLKSKRPCSYPGCPALVSGYPRCEQHRKQEQQRYNNQRGTAAQRGYGGRWQRYKGHGCLPCSRSGESAGVTLVRRALDELELKYKREVKLAGCKYINSLLFDFAVIDKTGDIKFLIEYDGKHHFRSKQKTGGLERLYLIQKRDKVKNDYCLMNDIALLRIKYTIAKGDNAYLRVKKRIIDFTKTAMQAVVFV